ncbi:MAG: DNA photolyase family protein [Hyphomicrobiaceae bacterium]|nr:DNA photolyase family protein [Hyphomicrobiaceae bacterium]
MKPVIVWFRQDLRVADHRPLTAAVDSGAPVIPCYILDDVSPGTWALGGASKWWLHHSLGSLTASLTSIGSYLVLRRGDPVRVLAELAAETGAGEIVTHAACEPWATTLEGRVHDTLAKDGVILRRLAGVLLKRPDALRTKAGQPFKVYTPFWRAMTAAEQPAPPLPKPSHARAPSKWPTSDALDSWQLLPRNPDWSGGFSAVWSPGERGANERLEAFLQSSLVGYGEERNRPDKPGTSRLSPHIHNGEISVATCWHQARAAADAAAARGIKADKGLETFLKELVWRDFAAHLLVHWPTLPDAPFKPEFSAFPWRSNDDQLRAWQRGRTGYPIVDAGMRQLWHTGWMHNRVRMITASFLVKHLLQPWQAGETWFWDTLVDADLASNSASWQWVAGCGADAAPYFRIFNPVKQGETYDPDGSYVREWVPELAKMPAKFIHAPWTAQPMVLTTAGVTLGRTYPLPIVDHAAARDGALAALKTISRSSVAAETI